MQKEQQNINYLTNTGQHGAEREREREIQSERARGLQPFEIIINLKSSPPPACSSPCRTNQNDARARQRSEKPLERCESVG